jgi:tRNA pseudouridine38-40 synthase
MAEAAACLVGEHDFSAFRAAECDAASPVRRLHSVSVAQDRPGLVTLTVRGTGFLRNMVRILAGTLVQVGIGKRPASWVEAVLDGRDRTKAGMTAPPQGLILREVEYP